MPLIIIGSPLLIIATGFSIPFHLMDAKELKQSIKASEGWTALSEIVACRPHYAVDSQARF